MAASPSAGGSTSFSFQRPSRRPNVQYAVVRFGKQGGQPCRRGLWKSSIRASMPVRAPRPRCMESLHDFDAVHRDHEPFRGTPFVWSPAFRRSGPAKAGTPNGRFMESPYSLRACIGTMNLEEVRRYRQGAAGILPAEL